MNERGSIGSKGSTNKDKSAYGVVASTSPATKCSLVQFTGVVCALPTHECRKHLNTVVALSYAALQK